MAAQQINPVDVASERTIGGILRRRAQATPDRRYAVFPDRSWTFIEFDRWVDRLANGLRALGVVKGAKVALMLPNCSEFLGVWFACARLGAVEVPVNTNIRGHLLRHILHHSDSVLLVTRPEFLDALSDVIDDLPCLDTVVVADRIERRAGPANKRWEPFETLESCGSEPIEVAVDPADPAAIVFTSGTTGPSKGAVLSHNYFWWFGERCSQLRHMTEDERLYTCLPLFHANAQALTAMPALIRGQTAVLDTHFTASGYWRRLREFGATQFNYIGGMIPILMKQPPSPDDRAHGVRLALGAAAPRNQWLEFEERFGLRVMECYGQTEDCAVTANPLDETRIGSIGKAAWGYQMQVVGDDGNVLPDGETGEFVVRPERPGILMQGYYKMPEETLGVYRDLWFHTGDYGWRDADGYFYFMDRKKDALRRRGENISAYEVEIVVNEHPAVLESAVYAVPSEVGEDDVMVAAILKEGHSLSPVELIEHCQTRLAYFAVPRYVDFRAEFPKTPTHRVEKYKLRQEGVTQSTWDREKAGFKLRR